MARSKLERNQHTVPWRYKEMAPRALAKASVWSGGCGCRGPLHVMTQGYIESITHVRRLPHRDFPAASLLVDGIALCLFWALSMDIPNDEVCAQFVAMPARVFPRRWIIHRMPMRRGSLWVICSTVVHEGGGLPVAAEPGSRRIIGFCGLSTTTHAITPPFWAHKAAVSCGVRGCRRKPTSEKCFGCGV